MNSRLWEQKIEKHEIQKIDCDGEPKADENWMIALKIVVNVLWIHQLS